MLCSCAVLTAANVPAQGIVRSADELHALEEQEFQQWLQHMQQYSVRTGGGAITDAGYCKGQPTSSSLDDSSGSFGGNAASTPLSSIKEGTSKQDLQALGAVSYFETRLEYWRQLWRTLEMSDAAVMIVDIR